MVFEGERKPVLVDDPFTNTVRFILTGPEDPTIDGVRAPIGSLFLRNDGSIYRKTGTSNTTWLAIDSGNIAIEEINLGADQFDNPVNADFVVNALAPAEADPLNTALVVRAFDDAVEEGIAFGFTIPSGATNMNIRLISRAAAAPGVVVGVAPILYARTVPNNAPVTAWSAGSAFGPISIPTNTNFQYDNFTLSLISLGITDGTYVQFELTRDPVDPDDDLLGDWLLLEVGISFT